MKIIEWNLHFAGNHVIECIPSFIGEYINEQDADIIVLTEIVKGKAIEALVSSLGFDEYKIFYSKSRSEKYGNGVCILAKKLLNPTIVAKDLDSIYDPDIVHIEVCKNGKKYNIIGNRIRIDIKKYQEITDFKFRAEQSNALIKYASQFENVIVIGDQNTGNIDYRDDFAIPYDDIKGLYKGNSRAYYNAHLLKNNVEKNGFTLYEPKGMNTSVGFIYRDTKILFNEQWKNKIDLAFCSRNLEYSVRYLGTFLDKYQSDYLESCTITNEKVKCGHGFPDHAMLIVEIN